MRPLLILLILICASPPALAWNAAGHRLAALIAWQQMSPPTRSFVATALAGHPDHGRWREKAGADDPALIFAEASTWADAIRHDPRFADETAPPLPGFPDMAAHGDWHYVDFDKRGKRGRGQIDRKILELREILRSTVKTEEISWALPWLAHLVGDLHQPFHVGRSEDRGGNSVLVEDPAARQPFVKLHAWWDDLPGSSGLRGKRLQRRAGELLAGQPTPEQGEVGQWLRESRRLLARAYPATPGSVSAQIDDDYRTWASQTAERRVTEAGYRLGRLLEEIHRQGVSRETASPRLKPER